MAITLREGLGRKLTIAEMDENFLFLSSSYVVNSITGSMTASFADSATSASIADEISQLATASFADSATTSSHTAGTASIADFATLLSTDATASFADKATTASFADQLKGGTAISASSIDITGDLSVAGTASFGLLQSVTASEVLIGDAFVNLNADTPTQRFAGVKVIDSGSDPYTTASFVYDGDSHDWKYEYESGGDHDAAVALFGPVMSDLTGSFYPVSESVLVGTGGHHVTSSLISVSDGVMTVAGTITETSALRYKENVQPLDGSLSKVIQLNPVEYDWKSNGKHDIGLVAEEVNKILPDLVSKNGRWVQGISYSKLTAVLIGAIKELTARVEELENK